jgi:hypothetical protein
MLATFYQRKNRTTCLCVHKSFLEKVTNKARAFLKKSAAYALFWRKGRRQCKKKECAIAKLAFVNFFSRKCVICSFASYVIEFEPWQRQNIISSSIEKDVKSSLLLDQSNKCNQSRSSLLLCWQDCAQRNSSKNQPQSRQSVKIFLKSSELGLSQPPRFWGRVILAGERGIGRVPIPTRGHTLWYSLYKCTLWNELMFYLT